ncbi:hypothetical protein KQI52_12070 [bacterium]|nr:hypothetical protein [bacterium]
MTRTDPQLHRFVLAGMIALGVILTLHTSTFAQPALHWQHIYGDTLSQSGTAGMVQLPSSQNGDLIIAGEINHAIPLLFDMHLTRITVDGDSVWMRSHDIEQTQHAYAIALSVDSTTVAVAGANNWESGGNYYTNCMLNLFDTDGNHLHTYTDGATWIAEAYTIIATPDNGFIFAGKVEDDVGPSPEQNVWVVKVDDQADLVWSREFDIDEEDEAHAIIRHPDGGYMIAGHAREENAPLRWNTFLLHIDEDGNELDRRHYVDDSADEFVYALHFTAQGRLYLAGESYVPDQPNQRTDGFLTLLDFDLNPIDTRYIGGTGYDGFRTIDPLEDGDLLLAGHAQSYSANGNEDLFVVRVNALGAELWHGSFGDTGNDKGYALLPVDGPNETHFILAGTSAPRGQSHNKNVIAARISARLPWVRLTLTSDPPDTVDIPAGGGDFDYTATLENNTGQMRTLAAWAVVQTPDSVLTPPVRMARLHLDAESRTDYPQSQTVSADADTGLYRFIGRLGHYPNEIFSADTLLIRKNPPDPESSF